MSRSRAAPVASLGLSVCRPYARAPAPAAVARTPVASTSAAMSKGRGTPVDGPSPEPVRSLIGVAGRSAAARCVDPPGVARSADTGGHQYPRHRRRAPCGSSPWWCADSIVPGEAEPPLPKCHPIENFVLARRADDQQSGKRRPCAALAVVSMRGERPRFARASGTIVRASAVGPRQRAGGDQSSPTQTRQSPARISPVEPGNSDHRRCQQNHEPHGHEPVPSLICARTLLARGARGSRRMAGYLSLREAEAALASRRSSVRR